MKKTFFMYENYSTHILNLVILNDPVFRFSFEAQQN
jgi:hypothetical protein